MKRSYKDEQKVIIQDQTESINEDVNKLLETIDGKVDKLLEIRYGGYENHETFVKMVDALKEFKKLYAKEKRSHDTN